jgi:putative phosphoesterase
MLRIAVISDTHDFFPASLHATLKAADEIWHLGDVCSPSVLDEVSSIGPPLVVVRGNNDWVTSWPESLDLERGGVRFHLVHIAPRRPPVGADALLHGHTHEPSDTRILGTRLLNPGALFRPRGGSTRGFAWLHVGPEAGPDGFTWSRVAI